MRRLRSGPLRGGQRPQQGGAGHALGPNAGFPVHVGEHAGLHVALPGDEAGDLQGAWHAVAGGSDIALCADLTIMGDTAQIGYMPTRVWGCPTTAMWVHRLGPEKAKRMMFTGDKITGVEAAEMGLVLKSVPDDQLDAEVEALAARMASVPINQLAMQKMVINAAVEEKSTRRSALPPCSTASPAIHPRA